MNWEAIGPIGEIVGVLAVFLTLIYLAIQIKQNTIAVQASAMDFANGQVSQIREGIFADPFRSGKQEAQLQLRPEARTLGLTLTDLGAQCYYAGIYTELPGEK